MKRKVLVAVIALCFGFLFPSLPPSVEAATIANLEPASGPVGQLVKFTGSISCGGSYEIYWDNFNKENVIVRGQATACKYATAQFRVPETYKGRHRVILLDLENQEEASYDFRVIPEIKTPVDKGPVGSVVVIYGTGFAANEADIQVSYEGTAVTSGITSNIKGTWSGVIDIPESPKGKHSIQASGSLTNASEVKNISYEVTPKMSLEPSFGGIGADVTVTGTGFAPDEKDITITFDGGAVRTGITANNLGSFNTTFTVPNTDKKENVVNIFVKNDKVTEASNVIFTIGRAVTLQPTTAYVGDEVTVYGSGFAPSENNIKLMYDDTEISTGITANTKGVWTTTFTIPASTAGNHPVSASGSSTPAQEVKFEYFTVLPRLTLSPVSGGAGTAITATGSGFGKSKLVTIMYDNIKLTLDIKTDAKGNFTAEFKALGGTGEQHQVNATDEADNEAAATFFTETNPPSAPSAVFPAPEAKVGLIGKQAVAFQWSEVTDPSGVSYVLEISREADFSSPILQRKDLAENNYTLNETEALDQGSYYWRVKAIDGAGNESEWTTAQPFTVSGLKLNTFLIIVAALVVVALLIILWRFTPLMGRK